MARIDRDDHYSCAEFGDNHPVQDIEVFFFFFLMISKDVKQYVFIFQIETITWNFYLEGRGGVRVESKVI
jgi:hypothetical protein